MAARALDISLRFFYSSGFTLLLSTFIVLPVIYLSFDCGCALYVARTTVYQITGRLLLPSLLDWEQLIVDYI